MGLDASLLSYTGEQLQVVGDPKGTLHLALRESDLSGTVCLRFIDVFGRTTFNRAQARVVGEELSRLRSAFPKDVQDHIDRLQRLVELLDRGKGYELQLVGD